MMWEKIPVEWAEDGYIKHIVKDGARYHVASWSNLGTHCSEPKCEINRPVTKVQGERWKPLRKRYSSLETT